jgi:membrane-associated phospholipid phosphatase
MTVWRAITSLGDSALLLPLIAWMALSLILTRRDGLQGFRWIAAACVCGGLVALSKLLFMGWGVGAGLPGLNYTGFSGHTALSMLTWPALAGLLSRNASRPVQSAAISLGVLIGAGVAISRIFLKAHSISEVVLGAILGVLIAAWFLHGLLRHARLSDVAPPAHAARRQLLLLSGGAVIALLCYGRVFPSQHVLKDLALWLSGHPTVFSRRINLG